MLALDSAVFPRLDKRNWSNCERHFMRSWRGRTRRVSILISSSEITGGLGSAEGCRDAARRTRRVLAGASSGGIEGSSEIEFGIWLGDDAAAETLIFFLSIFR